MRGPPVSAYSSSGGGQDGRKVFSSPALGGKEKVKVRRCAQSKCVKEASRKMCRFCMVGRCVYILRMEVFASAGIAQLGERKTEDLKVPCSIHGHGIHGVRTTVDVTSGS